MARAATPTRKRPSRSSSGSRDVLTVQGKDDNFIYRVVNDVPGRVAEMQSRGYELAEGDEVFLSNKDSSRSEGSVKSKHVGGGINGVLMKIPKEWYNEDQALKMEHIKKVEQSTKTSNIKGGYGSVKIE